jgi:hypothetical protein
MLLATDLQLRTMRLLLYFENHEAFLGMFGRDRAELSTYVGSQT